MPNRTALIRLVAGLACAGAAPAMLCSLPAHAANPADNHMFTLHSITFDGNARVSTDTLNSVVGLTVGQKVDRQNIVDAFNRVIAEYQKENVGGNIQPEMRTANGRMDLTFKISEAAAPVAQHVKPKLGHETFTGNKKVKSSELQSAMTIQPGSDVTREQIIADRDALAAVYKGAGLPVGITPQITNLPGGQVDINFEINEKPPSK